MKQQSPLALTAALCVTLANSPLALGADPPAGHEHAPAASPAASPAAPQEAKVREYTLTITEKTIQAGPKATWKAWVYRVVAVPLPRRSPCRHGHDRRLRSGTVR